MRSLPRSIFLLLALGPALLAATPAAAADVLLPDFTPATMDDFEVADQVGQLARMALEDHGLDVIAGDDLAELVGSDADTCADDRGCPMNLWDRVTARLAVVGRVQRVGELLQVRIQIFNAGSSIPRRTYDERLPSSEVGDLMLRVADGIAPPAQAEGPEVSRPSSGIVEEHYAPIRSPDQVREADSGRSSRKEPDLDAPERKAPERKATDRAPVESVDPELQALHLPAYALRRYRDSGLSTEDWLEQARVRTPSVFLELHGGAVLGDLDRRYDTRVGLYDEQGDAFSDRNSYSYHTFLNGRGFQGGAAVGYQPAWWIDASILGGVQLGHKELTTGWETWRANGNPDGTDEYLDGDKVVYDPVSAVLGMLEPRVRLYPLALGPLKPYVLVGFNLRFYDAYSVPDQTFVSYPEAGGGIGLGPTLGGGLALDAPKGTVGFIEVPWTYVVSPSGPQISDTGGLQDTPTQFLGVGQYLRFTAGLAIHLR